jgi:hypothetical protein
MKTDDRSRTHLHERLDGAVGHEAADTLMGYLPPVGWQDVVTKRDLDTTERVLRAELHSEMDKLRADLYNAMRLQTIALVTIMLAIAGIARVL